VEVGAGLGTVTEIASASFSLSRVLDSETDSGLQSLIRNNPEFGAMVRELDQTFSRLGVPSIYKLTVSSISGPGTIAPTLNATTLRKENGAFYERTLALETLAYTGPAARATTAAPALAFHASTEVRDDIYVFGGKTPTGLSDKLYKISRNAPTQWIEISASSAEESGRGSTFGDNTGSWSGVRLEDPIDETPGGGGGQGTRSPAARMGAYLANSGDFLILYGGTNADQSVIFTDLWTFKISEGTWTELSTNLIQDSGVSFASTFGTKIENRGQLLILGGLDESGQSGPGVNMDLAGIALARSSIDLAALIQPVTINGGIFHFGSSTLDPNGNSMIASVFNSYPSPYSQTLAYWNGSEAVPVEMDAESHALDLIAPFGGVFQTSGNSMYYLGGSRSPDTQAPELYDGIFTIDVSNGTVRLIPSGSDLAKRMGAIGFVNSEGNIITHGGLTETHQSFTASSDIIEFNPARGSLRNISIESRR
jgi:hypothetical protein